MPARTILHRNLQKLPAHESVVEEIEFFKGEKKPRYLVKKPTPPGVYSFELEGNKFLFTGTYRWTRRIPI